MSSSSGGGRSSSGEEAEDAYFYRDSKSQRASRRRRRREDATYGVFGDELDGEEDGDGGMMKGGLGFVSFVQKEELVGVGTMAAPVGRVEKDAQQQVKEEDTEYENVVVGAFGRRVRKAAAERREQEWGGAGGRTKQVHGGEKYVTASTKSNVGTFEAHTKGIGAKLLSKMGWKEGQGLGKDGKGLSQPLEAKLRPKRQGMGFGNRREPSLAPTKQEEDTRTGRDEIEAANVQQEAKMWRKQRADSKLKENKQIFKTVDDVLASSDGAVKSSIQTIIDMRGPQKRIINDVGAEGALMERQHQVHDEGPLPELQHNMRLLVDLNEAEIKKVDARIHHSRNTKTLLEKERLRLQKEKSLADDRKRKLARAVSIATKIQDDVQKGMHMSAESRKLFSEAKSILKDDYYRYQLNLLAAAVVYRSFVEQAREWSPLSDPTMLLAQISEWKPLLTIEDHSNQLYPDQDVDIDGLFDSSDPFVMLIVETVLTKLRSDIQSSWDPRDSEALESFLESWKFVLPNNVLLYAMQHVVLPKLRMAVEQWEPLVDTIAPHTWLFPHLPFLGNHAQDMWPIIRLKFVSALSQWHPSDPTALEMLKPWRQVFSSHEWDQLCSRAIEPKLSHVLDTEFFIHPSDQDLEPFAWVMAWDTEIRPERFAKILDEHFFPKWRAALRHMLMHDPNYDEIARWYLSWKSYMSDDVLETALVSKNINSALNDMSRAVAGEPLEPTWTTAPEHDFKSPTHSSMKLKASQRAQRTMKELIAQFAEDSGVDFVPKLGRMHEGLQVYHFGLVLCAVNTAHETILAQIDPHSHTWKTVSLDELLDENDRRLRQHHAT